MNKVTDKYLEWPVVWDIIIAGLIYYAIHYVALKAGFDFAFAKADLLNIVSNLIGTCVSLAGFILAALTIIITFKSNLQVRGIKEAENALQLILSSVHYDKIVRVYQYAILEYVLVFVMLYCVWLFSSNMSLRFITIATAGGITLTSLTIVRSLLILFKILGMEKKQDNPVDKMVNI
jgi:hypothetical protein